MTVGQALEIAHCHHRAGRLSDAEKIYRQILSAEPNHADALHLLGVIANQVGRHDLAVELIQRAIAANPSLAPFHSNLGLALTHQGRLEEAIAEYRTALRLQPDFADAHNNLGIALARTGQPEQALTAYRRAVQLNPNYAEAYSNLGDVCRTEGKLTEALDAYHAALRINPQLLQSSLGAAITLLLLERADEAIANLQSIVREHPGHADAWNNLGIALKQRGDLTEAMQAYDHALRLIPASAEVHNNLGNVLKESGRIREAVDAFRRAIELKPDFSIAHSNLVFSLNALPDQNAAEVASEHRNWAARHADPIKQQAQPPISARRADRRLRIAYVSPNFCSHPVASFILPLLENHNRSEFEIYCYSDVARQDRITQSIRHCADKWRDTVRISDAQLAEQIRGDGIDILVDLAGHTLGNRLLVFARKPARLQITYLGYPNTTGLTQIDYRFTDAFADPIGLTEKYHSERLVRLPDTFLCFKPSGELAVPRAAPNACTGGITFGCFNVLAKINAPLIELWSGILHRVPASRLLLKAKAFSDDAVRARILSDFARHSIMSSRLVLRGWEPTPGAHLRVYDEVDIALDTFPYHGTTTTCEAMWMGVPVVTLAGDVHVSRVGVSLLNNVGLPQLIAGSRQEYVQIAATLACDADQLRSIRSNLRERMAASPLLAARQFANNVEQAFRDMFDASSASPR